MSLQILGKGARAYAVVSLVCLPLAAQSRAQRGEWGSVVAWPHVPAHIAQLNDGRMLTWAAATPDDFNLSAPNYTVASVFDPRFNSFQNSPNPRQNMFCSGLCRTIDGRVMAVGGGAATTLTSLFNPSNSSWTNGGDTALRRWYPTAVTLPSGQLFTVLGSAENPWPEVWTPNTNSWSIKYNINLAAILNEYLTFSPDDYEWYPWLHVAPNSNLFYSGPTPGMYWIDPDSTGTNNVQYIRPRVAGDRMRIWASTIMYRPGKLLITGGRDMTKNPPATSQTLSIDINGNSPVVTATAPMNYARAFHHAITLPNGEIFVAGGNTNGQKFTDNGAILTPEIWNPNSNSWRLAAPMSVPRPYHSTAALLKDGRVLIIGGGVCGPCGANHPDGQIYSPPYLFSSNGAVASRPALSINGSGQARPGNFIVARSSSGISSFNLIRLQATTHGMQTDTRFVPTTIWGGNWVGSGLIDYYLRLPSNGNVLVPGDYWLFAVNQNGTPSTGQTIRILP